MNAFPSGDFNMAWPCSISSSIVAMAYKRSAWIEYRCVRAHINCTLRMWSFFSVFHHQSLHCEFMHAHCTAPILHLIASTLLLWASFFASVRCKMCSRLFYIDFKIIPRYNAQWLLYYRLCYSLLYRTFSPSLSLLLSMYPSPSNQNGSVIHHFVAIVLFGFWFSFFCNACIHLVPTTNCCCYFSFVAAYNFLLNILVHFSSVPSHFTCYHLHLLLHPVREWMHALRSLF